MDMDKYFEKIGVANKRRILERKINVEIFLFYLMMFFAICLIIYMLFITKEFLGSESLKGKMQNSDLYTPIFIGALFGLFTLTPIILVAYSEKEVFKQLKTDDRIFIWIYFFKEKVENYKHSKMITKNLRLILTRNKVIDYIRKIRKNLEAAFIFNQNSKSDIERLKRLESAFSKLSNPIINFEKYKSHIIDLLKLLINLYSFTVLEHLFTKDKTFEVSNEFIKENFEKLDEKINEIERLENNTPKNSTNLFEKFKNIKKQYIVSVFILFMGFFMILFMIINNKVTSIIANISSVVTICVALLTLANRKA